MAIIYVSVLENSMLFANEVRDNDKVYCILLMIDKCS